MPLAISISIPCVADADAGAWTTGGPYGGGISVVTIDPSNPATLYVGTSFSGIFKSTDAGATWASASSGLTYLYLGIRAVAVDPSTPTTVYAGTGQGVFKSTDAGGTWIRASIGLPNDILDLVIDPSTPTTLYAGTIVTGVFKSTDAAANWAPASSGLPNDPASLSIWSLALD